MNWFQQNRWLGTFLIAFGFCALLAGIFLYFATSKWSVAKKEFDTAAAERLRLERLDPFPNDANYQKMKVYLEKYSAALDKFKEELKTSVLPALPLAPNEFQSRLRQVTTITRSRASTNKVKLPDKFQLGFDEFEVSNPVLLKRLRSPDAVAMDRDRERVAPVPACGAPGMALAPEFFEQIAADRAAPVVVGEETIEQCVSETWRLLRLDHGSPSAPSSPRHILKAMRRGR